MDFRLYFRSRQGEILNLLKKITHLESPTDNKKAVDACSGFVVQEFRKAGCRVKALRQEGIGDLHVIEYPAGKKDVRNGGALVLTHIDTVWPVGKIARMPYYVAGDKVFGPGVLDMKSGIVMTIAALSALHGLNLEPKRKVTVFINTAEETGDDNAHREIKRLARNAAFALCLEPALPGGGLKLERKGRLVLKVEAHGRSAHAGNPKKGVNAIDELMAGLARLKKIQQGETTMSTGVIRGGEKANIVPETALALVDVRFWKASDKARVVEFARSLKPSLKGARLKVTFESETPPMEKTPASARLFERARSIADGLGLSLTAGKSGGGSDGSIASSAGVPTLDGLGPDGEGMHAENEHALIPSLVERTALLVELLLNL
jgi:glutamate carboxypeptidase